MTRFEYDFVRLPLGRGIFRQSEPDYRETVRARARDGWRLVQVFAPPIFGYGVAGFYELIFERPVVTGESP